MEIVHAVLGLLAACIGIAVLARLWRLPYAVLLILVGMVLAFLPVKPDIALQPDVALAFFLPPLLMGSATAPTGGPSAAPCGRSCCWRWAPSSSPASSSPGWRG